MLNRKIMLNILIFFLIAKHSLQMRKFDVGRGIEMTCPRVSVENYMKNIPIFFPNFCQAPGPGPGPCLVLAWS